VTDEHPEKPPGCFAFIALTIAFALVATATGPSNGEGGMGGATKIMTFAFALPYGAVFFGVAIVFLRACHRRLPWWIDMVTFAGFFVVALAVWRHRIDPAYHPPSHPEITDITGRSHVTDDATEGGQATDDAGQTSDATADTIR
jgi:membrane protein implicated in regulation of membrane protease activity